MKFSVGQISIGTDIIGKATGISVRYDGGPVDMYAGGYPDPLEVELGNRSTTITVDYVEWTVEDIDEILSNGYVNVSLSGSAYDVARGISSLTLNRCKVVNYEITSTQDGFVSYRLELRKSYAT